MRVYKYEDISNQKFGEWTTLDYQGKGLWRCKCSCGNESFITKTGLRSGHTQRCNPCRNKILGENNIDRNKSRSLPDGVASFNFCYHSYKRNAHIRGIDFNVNKDLFRELTQQNCYWCGRGPSNNLLAEGCNGAYIYNGVDRVDNEQGYIEGNTVTCCKRCNSAKNDMTVDEFKSWITDLYHNVFKDKDNLDEEL